MVKSVIKRGKGGDKEKKLTKALTKGDKRGSINKHSRGREQEIFEN